MGAASLIGAIAGSEAQRSSANKASDASVETAKIQAKVITDMYNQNRADMLPFIKAAQGELSDLMSFDISGSSQKYLDKLDKLQFRPKEDDPIFQWKMKEATRQVDQFMASRGKYDSRAAANMLQDAGMKVRSEELDRQQNYLTKMATLGMTKDINKYGQMLDVVKLGTGAGATAGAWGQNTANMLANVYGQQGQAAQNAILQSGAAQANLWNSLIQQDQNAAAYAMMYGGR